MGHNQLGAYMHTYDAKCTSRNGITVAQATLEIPKDQDVADYVRAWAAKAGAVGWSVVGPPRHGGSGFPVGVGQMNDDPMTREEALYKRIEDAGHRLRRELDGSVDPNVLDQEDEEDGVWVNWHYGPGCELCGEKWCQNCNPSEIKPCKCAKDEE